MSLLRLVQRIIALALALSALALILVILGVPGAILWHTFLKRSPSEN